MHKSRLASASLLVAWLAPAISTGSTLVQTQLKGVRGAMVLSFVSQYLPPEAKALEPELKAMASKMLLEGGLSTSSEDQQYLTIDVSGDPISGCADLYVLRVRVAYEEPVVLKRAPTQPIPNSSVVVTWDRSPSLVVEKSTLVAKIREAVGPAVEAFVEQVQSVNRQTASARP